MGEENPVHYPENPEKFEFDESVAKIFPNMAERSIPIYWNMHGIHAKILVDDYLAKISDPEFTSTYSVLDVGASRGAFYASVLAECHNRKVSSSRMEWIPTDKSKAMCDQMGRDFHLVHAIQYDITDPEDDQFDGRLFDAIGMHLVMQFIPMDQRGLAYERLGAYTKHGGLLFYAEKEKLHGGRNPGVGKRIAKSAHDFYIDFRVENGYSREEIEAKTKALKNSMWEVDFETNTKPWLHEVGFAKCVPTTRVGVFHSFVAARD